MSRKSLDGRLGHLMAVSALTVCGDAAGLEVEVRSARQAGVAAPELREAVLVASLFGGFPRAVQAQNILKQVLGAAGAAERRAPGRGGQADPERGERVFRHIHGRRAGPQIEMLRSFPGAFSHAIFGEAYGRVLAREVFDLKTRELIAVACLSVLELPRVLHAHLMAARDLGAGRELLGGLIRHVGAACGRDPEDALQVLRRMRSPRRRPQRGATS